MADIVSPEKRSEMMSGIRSKNTKPELVIRKALHALGFRYKLHTKNLPGKPDLVFPKFKAVFFVNGCFWHGHSCDLFKMPASKTEFWTKKISRNRELDSINAQNLIKLGWRVGVIWECSIRGRKKLNFIETIDACKKWLQSNEIQFEIRSTL